MCPVLRQAGDVVPAVHEHVIRSIEQMLVSATETPESATDFFRACHREDITCNARFNLVGRVPRRMAHRVTLIPGDGTGPELAEVTRRVLEATGVEFDWDVQHAGTDGDAGPERRQLPPPEHVLYDPAERDGAERPDHDAQGGGFRSVNVGLRKSLDLYGQVRPWQPRGRPLALRERRPDRDPREHQGPLRGGRVRGGHGGRGRAARLVGAEGLPEHPPRLRHLDCRSPRQARARSSSSPSTTRAATAAARSRRSTRRTS